MSRADRPASLTTSELVREVVSEVGQLARTQVELAAAEARADLRAGLGAVTAFSVAAVAGLIALNLLLATAVLALAQRLPAWAAGLVVSGGVAAVAAAAGVLGWRKRVRKPLERTRRSIEEDGRLATDGTAVRRSSALVDGPSSDRRPR